MYQPEKIIKFRPIKTNKKDNPFYKKLIKTEELKNLNPHTLKAMKELELLDEQSSSHCFYSEGNTPTP